MRLSKCLFIAAVLSASYQSSNAGTISDTFATGDTLTATHVNNFKGAVNDNDGRVTALETTTGASDLRVVFLSP